ncbi:uncharacterized protein K460DRAFT_356125 [Cucurbitaria berberidis CBS 394.84]|uniref:Uncharacterized protein n=1 Tax=Cucurbitaria berberidis CBS 394.84 TaxID=1168544 RepID=A0A9P4GJ81_9PLEO|nr:uncharacterized protein K460DRAFT_356125 [Cucurbitaria berberidis CBS 394.84]KAF1846449.1 hypothetical protein K460DRAFT_356125 [Cucurbitaria berberidis CBS 394.84]
MNARNDLPSTSTLLSLVISQPAHTEMAAPCHCGPIEASMRFNPHDTASSPDEAAFGTDSDYELFTGASLPQRPSPQRPPPHLNELNSLTLVRRKQKNVIRHYGKDAKGFVPTEFTWAEGPSNFPGTAEYYKSNTFRKKKDAGNVHVPGAPFGAVHNVINSDNEDFGAKNAKSEKRKSLIMVFSKATVRRVSEKRKAHRRLQRYNRRMRSWRMANEHDSRSAGGMNTRGPTIVFQFFLLGIQSSKKYVQFIEILLALHAIGALVHWC